MAKPLVFEFEQNQVEFQMNKVDRSKLYGFKESEVLDEQGQNCELATLAEDGRTVVGRGGTGIGYLSTDGSWCDKSELRPVDLEGEPIIPVPSSFSGPIKLDNRVTVQEYLNHNIRSIYQLETENQVRSLLDELKSGTIFKFDYSFRGGLEADAGFLLVNHEGILFLAIGVPTRIEFVGMNQPIGTVIEEADDDDLMDFGMI